MEEDFFENILTRVIIFTYLCLCISVCKLSVFSWGQLNNFPYIWLCVIFLSTHLMIIFLMLHIYINSFLFHSSNFAWRLKMNIHTYIHSYMNVCVIYVYVCIYFIRNNLISHPLSSCTAYKTKTLQFPQNSKPHNSMLANILSQSQSRQTLLFLTNINDPLLSH